MATIEKQLKAIADFQLGADRYVKPEDWPAEFGTYITRDEAKANMINSGQHAIGIGRRFAEEAAMQPRLLRDFGRAGIVRAIENAVDDEFHLIDYADHELLPTILDVRDGLVHLAAGAFDERILELEIAGAGKSGRC